MDQQSKRIPKNPFEVLEDGEYTTIHEKHRAEHHDYRHTPEGIRKAIAPIHHGQPRSLNAHIHVPVKENQQQIRKEGGRPNKELEFDHRYHDRRSANIFMYGPRKNGGGAGGVGTLRDQLNQDKIMLRDKQRNMPDDMPIEEKADLSNEVGPALTLDQYYRKLGVNMEEIDKLPEKQPIIKKEINPKELESQKLTLVHSKKEIGTQAKEMRPQATTMVPSHQLELDQPAKMLGFQIDEVKKPHPVVHHGHLKTKKADFAEEFPPLEEKM